MYKLKTKKIVAKRFKVTKNGLLLRGKQNSRHLRANKSRRQIRGFRKSTGVSAGMDRAIRSFLPYA